MEAEPNRGKQERSPRSPSHSLAESLDNIEKVYRECGRSEVPAEVAAAAMGYSSLSGASRTALASLSYYNLLHRQGVMQKVSDVALRILRPLSESSKLEALSIAVKSPQIFADLWDNQQNCSENVLSSILVHRGYTEEGARKTARVFKENVEFMSAFASLSPVDAPEEQPQPVPEVSAKSDRKEPEPVSAAIQREPRAAVLATYKIPLGANEAELVFTGEVLEPEDFDALIDYVEIFKRQFLRKLRAPKDSDLNDSKNEPNVPIE